MSGKLIAPVLFVSVFSGCANHSGTCEEQFLTAVPTGITSRLKPLKESPAMAFDRVLGQTQLSLPASIPAQGEFDVHGWAYDPIGKNSGAGVEIAIDGKPFATDDHGLRPDVAQAFANRAYTESGFSLSLPAAVLGRGDHAFTVRVITSDGLSYLESAPIRFVVE